MTTKKIKPAPVWRECRGEAHRNPYIDHCMVCLPWWGRYPTCSACGSKLRERRNDLICDKCKLVHSPEDPHAHQ